MKLGLSFLLLFLFTQVYSQSTTIDFILGGENAYRSLSYDRDDFIQNQIAALRNSRESSRLHYRIGLNINQRLAKKWWLKSGVRFLSTGFNGPKIEGLRFGSQFNLDTGSFEDDPNVPNEFKVIYNFTFVEIPIHLRYQFNDTGLIPFIEAGFSSNIYLSSKTITKGEGSRNTSKLSAADFRSLQFSVQLSFGLIYKNQSRYSPFIQPIYRYHISGLLTEGFIQSHLYNFGLEMGVKLDVTQIASQ